MYFDPAKASQRIALAQQRLNTAPSENLTHYWFRIWRARRRTYGLWLRKQRESMTDQQKQLVSYVDAVMADKKVTPV